MKVLLTGGAGYVGSHTAVELLNQGYEVSVIDNLSNSSSMVIERVQRLTNKPIDFYEEDLLNIKALDRIFSQSKFDAVIHFAGLKSVGESMAKPLDYYRVNIESSINLCQMMQDHKVNSLIFSSSATVYGEPERIPIDESCLTIDAANPYGRTKLVIERMLEDVCRANSDMNVIRLRYFNPVGAHGSGEIGEDPNGIPNNLLPFVSQVAVGRLKELIVFGNDYPTDDGTCIRDYIHVCDLARGHQAALNKIKSNPGLMTLNLGSGHGCSVLEMISTFERVNGIKIPYTIGDRRPGDIAVSYTDPSLAKKELGWQTKMMLDDICRDAWRWQKKNPQGYDFSA